MKTLYYTQDHEWVALEGDVATVGITSHAQEQLGDLVFVELPDLGQEVKVGDSVVVVESVKAASDVYAPLEGEVIAINEALSSDPALVNRDAEEAGWLWKMKVKETNTLEHLMDAASYQKVIG